MDDTEIDFLRRRIASENRLASEAGTTSAAFAHVQLARMYEARLEAEAARLVDGEILRECSTGDPALEAALRLLG